jgi:hypothetical protein
MFPFAYTIMVIVVVFINASMQRRPGQAYFKKTLASTA